MAGGHDRFAASVTAPRVNIALQRALTWSGVAFLLVFFGGAVVAGWIPPPRANQGAQDVAQMYRDDTTRIRAGALLIGASGLFQGLWAAVISTQLRRIENDRPLLTYAQLGAGSVGIIVVIIPAFLFIAAAYEPARDPEITLALHQLGWLTAVGIGWPVIAQCLAIGAAALTDRNPAPLFPRWFGYFNLLTAFSILPGPIVGFFHTGPFAWSGAGAFWVPGAIFGSWFLVTTVMLRRAIMVEAAEIAAPTFRRSHLDAA